MSTPPSPQPQEGCAALHARLDAVQRQVVALKIFREGRARRTSLLVTAFLSVREDLRITQPDDGQ